MPPSPSSPPLDPPSPEVRTGSNTKCYGCCHTSLFSLRFTEFATEFESQIQEEEGIGFKLRRKAEIKREIQLGEREKVQEDQSFVPVPSVLALLYSSHIFGSRRVLGRRRRTGRWTRAGSLSWLESTCDAPVRSIHVLGAGPVLVLVDVGVVDGAVVTFLPPSKPACPQAGAVGNLA